MKIRVSSASPHFKTLRSAVIALHDQYNRQELTSVPVKKIKARLDRARKELQEICRHERVAELMSRWSPKKTSRVKPVFSCGRVCMDCGLGELVGEMKGHFYRVLPEPSFFADFSELEKFTEFGGIEKQNLLKGIDDSVPVFRSLEDFVEKNS